MKTCSVNIHKYICREYYLQNQPLLSDFIFADTTKMKKNIWYHELLLLHKKLNLEQYADIKHGF